MDGKVSGSIANLVHCSLARLPPRDASGPRSKGACSARQKLVGSHHIPQAFSFHLPRGCWPSANGLRPIPPGRELKNTWDEEPCLDMPPWLASPGCRLNLARSLGLT